MLWLAACGRSRPDADTGAILRVSQRNEPSALDPALAALPDDFFVIRALSEGLLVPGSDPARPRAAAAQSWERSGDGLTWTFHLRPDGRWSDGEPVTAADFVASYQRVLDPAGAAPKAELLFCVRNARAYYEGRIASFSQVGFRAEGPLTLAVELEHPLPEFLAYAASGPWIPVNPRTVARLGRGWTRPGNFVGNGAFVLAEWTPGERIVVKRNPLYHGAAALRLGEIRFQRIDDAETEERAFRAGQLDLTMSVPFSEVGRYARERSPALHRELMAETRYLAFNLQRPALDDARVRRALSLAIDRTRLVRDVTQGGEIPARRLLPPPIRPAGEDGADPSDPDGRSDPSADAAEAARLLSQAGYPGGAGFPRLELSGWAESQQEVLEAIQDMWRRTLGVETVLAIREARVHVAALRAGRYDIGYMTLIPDLADPAAALARFSTGAAGNYPHWSDPAYDRTLEAAGGEPDPARRAALLRSAEARLLGQQPLAPLYFFEHNWLMRPEVRGWREDPFWQRDYTGISLSAAGK